MKRLITLGFVAILSMATVSAQGIEFFSGSWQEALDEAQLSGKLIFMDAYTTWCGPCKHMSNNVFPKPEVGEYFNNNFINVKVDCEKGEGPSIAKQYKVTAYPTMFWINGSGEVVHRVIGGRNPQQLIQEAQKAVVPNQALFDKMKLEYEDGKRDGAFLADYATSLMNAGMDYDKVFRDYLDAYTEEELLDPIQVNVIFKLTTDINSPGIDHFKNNQDYYRELLTSEVYDTKIAGVAFKSVSLAAKVGDDNMYKDALKFLKKQGHPEAKKLGAEYSIEYARRQKDWDEYEKAAGKYLKKYASDDPIAHSDHAWTLFNSVEEGDTKAYETAKDWLDKSVAMEDKYYNNTNLAYVLYALGNDADALVLAQYAFEKGKAEKVNLNKAYQLITKIEKERATEGEAAN